MKNMDPLNECVATLLNQSTDKFTADLWKDGQSSSSCMTFFFFFFNLHVILLECEIFVLSLERKKPYELE